MDTTARLDAIEAIKGLKARYFFCMDTKDWAGFGTVFAEDCVMDMSGEAPDGVDPAVMVFNGREHIVGAISSALATTDTIHHGHMPIIDLTSDDSATGIWAMEDIFYFPDGGLMKGYGHYRELYRKVGGRWQIAHTAVTRLHKAFTAGAGA